MNNPTFLPMEPDGEPEYYTAPDIPITITGFSIRDPESGKLFFQKTEDTLVTGRFEPIPAVPMENGICYVLPKSFIDAKTIACQVTLRNLTEIGITNLTIKEEHYLLGNPLQNFEFTCPFLAPLSYNTWENIYEPGFTINRTLRDALLKGPWSVVTRIYVEERLVLKNQAILRFD
ncbi:Signal transduction protein [Giardia muris]|uniref:Signal transduction protein n=1 Tax=Giardia muris TaxID=5742 RepID=A0A4Z1SSG4_GIAMU|nr:Signal transduction protein [Giardia muris]|eukprot:TNJ28882.1 Signal transduction protein [Giardia muris]